MWRFVSEPRSAHLSLMARVKVVSSFKRQIRRIVLSRGIAFQQTPTHPGISLTAQRENRFRHWSSACRINSIHESTLQLTPATGWIRTRRLHQSSAPEAVM